VARIVSGRVMAALAIGAAGGWAAAYVWWAAGGKGFRPAAKEAIKAGLSAIDLGRQAAAEWSEAVSDLVAEAGAERTQSLQVALEAPFVEAAADADAGAK